MPQKRTSGPVAGFYTALRKAGARYCAGCRSYAHPANHVCDGTPVVCRTMVAPMRVPTGVHHDPIDPQWTQLEEVAA